MTVLTRDHGLCQSCLRRGVVREGRVVDHIVALRDDWSKRLELANLQTLCDECHDEKHPERAANFKNKEKYKKRQRMKESTGVFHFKANEDLW
ncbi:HNH endonuclease [Furfurilactobacillus entadae]|uniref:HNH endonuclease n=1 Tax=Furfurilactobacillus entadae TaxID=2922307 RepID=UPI0035E6BF2C